MLQRMREKTQGIIAGAIVILVAITFALVGIQYYSRGRGEVGVVAKVNGEQITEKQVHRVYGRVQQQRLALLGNNQYLDQKSQARLKDQIANYLIKNKVLIGFTEKLDLYVGKEQVRATAAGMPIFLVDNHFSPTRVEQVLRSLGYTEQEFLQELQNVLLLGQLDLGITSSVFVLPNELDQGIKLIGQTRDFSYAIISPQRFFANVTFSDEEIEKYYEQHKNDFVTSEKVSIEYVELNADAVKNKIDFSNEKLEQFYKIHADLFAKDGKGANLRPFSQVKDKVKEVYERQLVQQTLVEQNDKLTDLAYTNPNSLDQAAAVLGLTIKTTALFTSKGAATGIAANPKIVKATFSDAVLKQGYNSNPIDVADNCVVVLRIKQHLPAAFLPLAVVRDRIIAEIKRNKMYSAAKQYGEGILRQLEQNRMVENLKSNNLVNDKGDKLDQDKGKDQSNQAIDKYGLTWHVATKIIRPAFLLQRSKGMDGNESKEKGKNDSEKDNSALGKASESGIDQRILSAAFGLPRFSKSEGKLAVVLVDLQDKGFALVKLIRVNDGDREKIPAKKQQMMRETLKKDWAVFEYDLLVGEVMRHARIKRVKNYNGFDNESSAVVNDDAVVSTSESATVPLSSLLDVD